METENSFEKRQLELAKKRVAKIKKYYTHLSIYLVVMFIYLAKNYLNAPLNFWPINILNNLILGIWTFIILSESVDFFLIEKFFGSQWQKEKINKIIEEENSNKQKWI